MPRVRKLCLLLVCSAIGGCATRPAPGARPPSSMPAEVARSDDQWSWVTPAPQGYDLADVWTFSRSDAWAVGHAGTILHWDGQTWSRIPSGTKEPLLHLFGAAPDDLWASGR